jgi:hypothetical protein
MINLLKKTKKQKTKAIKDNSLIYVDSLNPVPKIDLQLKPNYSKLIELLNFRTYSKSKTQDVFVNYLKDYFKDKAGKVDTDSYGNLYVTKGNAKVYPCVVAHTDINQSEKVKPQVIQTDEWIFGFDNHSGEQCGIGADDKVGVYFAVHMFDLFDNIKLFFPKDEEIGLVGTSVANQNFFKDCSMLVQLDRRSFTNDLCTYTNGIEVCSEEFTEAAKPFLEKYLYTTARGLCTDIGGIKKFDTVDCVAMNISCGYINEHSDEEVISIPHFENALNFGFEILKMGVDYKWVHTVPKITENLSYSSERRYEYFDDMKFESFNQTSIFDDWDNSLKHYKVDTPGGLLYLDTLNKNQDKYMSEIYPEYKDVAFRAAQLRHHFQVNEEDANYFQQYEIDECIVECYCPACGEYDLEVDNSLLLYASCNCCGSTFNIPSHEEQ